MELLSFIFGLGSLALSVYAVKMAKSAKEAVNDVVKRKDDQEDRESLSSLIEVLLKAKEAAKRRRRGAPEIQGAGRELASDIYLLTEAHDSLRTALPLSFNEELKVSVDASAYEIEKSLLAINDPASNRDGWADALADLQNLIPLLRKEERHMKNKELLVG